VILLGRQETTQVEVPAEAEAEVPEEFVEATQEEVTMLRGFRDLVGERWGYFVGSRMTRIKMNEKTAKERKAVREIRKAVTGDNLVQIITDGNIEGYQTKLKEIKEAREVVAKLSKPFRTKIAPLNKARKYLDNIAIPDSLKELGTPVQERFSLSQWITDALEAEKK